MMKKILLFAAAAFALAACTKETPVKEEGIIDASKLVFDIEVLNGNDTKGVKTGWENGDVVYVFFEDKTEQYLVMKFNGTSWSYYWWPKFWDVVDGQPVERKINLSASGKKLSAVYFPGLMINRIAYKDGAWRFGDISVMDGYYQMASGVEYTVTSTDDVNTLHATVTLTAPKNIVQIFVPESEAPKLGDDYAYLLTATHLSPSNPPCALPDGTVTWSKGNEGFPLSGYYGTLGGETGYYFWGILDGGAGTYDFDFQLVKCDKVIYVDKNKKDRADKYPLSSKSKRVTEKAVGGSFAAELSGLKDNGNFVSLGYEGGPLWATGNLGRTDNSAAISNTNYKIADPLEAGDYFQWGAKFVYNTSTHNDQWTGTTYEDGLLPKAQDIAYQVNNAWRIPTKSQFEAFIDNTSVEWIDSEGESTWAEIYGRRFTSKKNGISLFFPAAGYYYPGNNSVTTYKTIGCYWSSTPNGSDAAYYFNFTNGNVSMQSGDRRDGNPVRPVKN